MIGARRHRLRIESQTDTPDGAGQPIRTWSTRYTSVPAALQSNTQNETEASRKNQTASIVLFEIPFLENVVATDRVVWLQYSRTFGINSVTDPTGLRRVLVLECKEAA